MTVEEQAAVDKVKSFAKEAAVEVVKEVKAESAESVKALTAEIAELKAANKATQDHADKLDMKLQKSASEPKANVSFKSALIEALKEKQSDIETIVKNEGKQSEPFFMEVKAAVDLSVTNTLGTSAVTVTDNTGIISTLRKRDLSYLANVSVGSTSGNRALWIEETDEQGAPLFIGEGIGKPQASVKYVEKTANVRKVAVYGKVTTELMADMPQFVSYIQNNLMKRLQLTVENSLLSGDNTGDNLNGVKNVASAFAPGAAAASIKYANEFDVIDAVGTQVDLAFGTPNAIFVHPTTLQKMRALKSTTGEPLYKDFLDISGSAGLVIHGMKVISSTLIPVGEFLGGDMTAVHVLIREAINIQVGLDGNDFTNNKKTILLEQRLVQFVSANDTPLIVKGTFAAAITALLAP